MRAIKVKSCDDCRLFLKCDEYEKKQGMDVFCPLPKWPVANENQLDIIAHNLYRESKKVNGWRQWKNAIAIELKSIGVEVSDAD